MFLLACFLALFIVLAEAQDLTLSADNIHLVKAQLLTQEGRGFTPPPYAIDPASLPGTWSDVRLPYMAKRPLVLDAVQTQGILLPPTTIGWYRIPVSGAAQLPKPWYLYLPRWKSEGTIAIYNGSRLIYQSHANLLWNGWNHPLLIPLDDTSTTQTPHEILIRIQYFQGVGSALSSIRVGSYDALSWRFQTREWLQITLPYLTGAAMLVLGIFTFFVWIKHPQQKLYLLFFGISIASFLRTLHYHMGLDRLPISDKWFGWMTISSLFWLVFVTHLFICHLHQRWQPWLTRTMLVLTVTISLMTLPLFTTFIKADTIAPLAYLSLLVMGNLLFATGVRNCWLSKTRAGLILAAWGLISIQFGVWDWLLENNLINIENAYLGSYSNLGAFALVSIIMFQRYIGAKREVMQTNKNLSSSLQIREAELVGIYQRLREAEQLEMLQHERQRLTQDMHDGLGSSLVCALHEVEYGHLSTADIAQVLKGCIDDLKLTIDSMEPVEADLLLLLATLRFRLAPRLENTGIKLHWAVQDVPAINWLTPRNSLHILRILQEAFTNIIKHAHATEIRLSAAYENNGVLVMIADNGHGFNVNLALHNGGKGMSNQMRRAESIGGIVSWQSNNSGTQLCLWLPVLQGI